MYINSTLVDVTVIYDKNIMLNLKIHISYTMVMGILTKDYCCSQTYFFTINIALFLQAVKNKFKFSYRS